LLYAFAKLANAQISSSDEKANANTDIIKVHEDRVDACEYCGASGTIEILKTDETQDSSI
jgi:hypothetical protein